MIVVTAILVLLVLAIYARHILRVPGIHKKCVVITGCDSGFGRALARRLYDKGVYVFAGCYTQEAAKSLSKSTGERLQTFSLDVSNTESIQQAYDFVKENLPSGTVLWGLVNNAGVAGDSGPLDFMTRQAVLDCMQVNCLGVMEMTRIFLPLIRQSRGRIVNIASTLAVVVFPLVHPYTISKFAVKAFSEALSEDLISPRITRQEMKLWGVHVATLCPGWFQTNLTSFDNWEKTLRGPWERMDSTTREEYGHDYIDRYLDTVAKNAVPTGSRDLSPVLEAYEHALFAKWPYATYYPGIDAKCMIFLKTWGPSFIVEYIAGRRLQRNIPKVLRK